MEDIDCNKYLDNNFIAYWDRVIHIWVKEEKKYISIQMKNLQVSVLHHMQLWNMMRIIIPKG